MITIIKFLTSKLYCLRMGPFKSHPLNWTIEFFDNKIVSFTLQINLTQLFKRSSAQNTVDKFL